MKETQSEKCESVADLIKILGSTFKGDEIGYEFYLVFHNSGDIKIDLDIQAEGFKKEICKPWTQTNETICVLDFNENIEKAVQNQSLNALRLKKYWYAKFGIDGLDKIVTSDNLKTIQKEFKDWKDFIISEIREKYYRYNEKYPKSNFVCRDHCVELPNGMLRTGYTTRTLPEWAIIQMRDEYEYEDGILVTNIPPYKNKWGINEIYLQR